jgi:hypothetical protein
MFFGFPSRLVFRTAISSQPEGTIPWRFRIVSTSA